MIHMDASGLSYQQLNEKIRSCREDVFLENCCGQRFLGAGMGEKHIRIQGTSGNALGAYLNGASIEVLGNAQDAVGDTMNAGRIVVHGSLGDTAGYAMRGGEIYVRGDAGYRTGVHMKAYGDKFPVIVVGGRTGSFLGEYQAGGILIVLGLNDSTEPIVRNFPCTGMHGGKLFIRSACENVLFPEQVAPGLPRPRIWRKFCRIFKPLPSCLGRIMRKFAAHLSPWWYRTAKIPITRCMSATKKRGVL